MSQNDLGTRDALFRFFFTNKGSVRFVGTASPECPHGTFLVYVGEFYVHCKLSDRPMDGHTTFEHFLNNGLFPAIHTLRRKIEGKIEPLIEETPLDKLFSFLVANSGKIEFSGGNRCEVSVGEHYCPFAFNACDSFAEIAQNYLMPAIASVRASFEAQPVTA